MLRRASIVVVAVSWMVGCDCGAPPASVDAPSSWTDAGHEVGPSAPDVGADATPSDDTGPVDAGVDATGADAGGELPSDRSIPAPPAEVLRTGSAGLLLRGTVLLPTGAIAGEVLVAGDSIACAAASCAGHPQAATATVIDTHATISPGLIDGHNHATYNFLPEWVGGDLFDSRYVWRSDAEYRAHIRPESDGGSRGELICPATKWAELRSLVHGTTTMQGQSPRQACVDRLVRNADHYHGLGATTFGTSIAGPCEGGPETSSTAMNDTWRTARVAEWTSGSITRLAVHMGEGITGTGTSTSNVLREFDCYLGRATGGTRDYRVNLLRAPDGRPYGTAYFIHATALTAAQIDEAHAAGAYFVWSPSSNMILYGDTTDIAHMIEVGAVVGLGPDWTVSGEDEMLGEMRFALAYGRSAGIPSLTPRRIWEMATRDGARAVDLDDHIGTIEVGRRADLVVFGRVSGDPYRAVLESRTEDVRLVLIDGLGYYGDIALEGSAAVNGECEMLDACGVSKFLCVRNTPGASARQDESYEQIRTQLYEILQNGYAGGTAYGRGSELLEIIQCGT